VAELITLAEGQGAAEAGTAWFSWGGETTEQKERSPTEQGPHRLAKLPVTADAEALAALVREADVQTFEPREELAIHLPGRDSGAKYSTAVTRLVAQAPEEFFPDSSGLRHTLHEGGRETATRLRPLTEDKGST
jgi:hypothetical protein